jgi:hypothetical protein
LPSLPPVPRVAELESLGGVTRMKTFITAIIIGVGIEAGLVAALFGGGIGPCGPASPVSGFVLMLHIPGLSLVNALHIPDAIGMWLVALLYAAVWSLASLLFLRGRP